MKKTYLRLLGVVLFVLSLAGLNHYTGWDSSVVNVLSVALLMVFWWITEATPIYVTALLPMVLFPLLGVMDIGHTTENYGNPVIFLFFGGFLIAKALEKWNLHRRIALHILSLTGSGARRIILGTMIATALLSMWISNTATALMMLPIALSIVQLFLRKDEGQARDKDSRNFAALMMLGVAYGANIGGIATLIGTPPNVVLAGILENTFEYTIPFSNWMLMGVPLAVILLLGSYFLMVRVLMPVSASTSSFSNTVVREELARLGEISLAEKRVLLIFSLTAFLWIFRQWLVGLFPVLEALDDTQIAVFGGMLMFMVPAEKNKNALLDWKDAQQIPWGILLLFGGGMALASGLEAAGILEATAGYFKENPVESRLLLIAGVTFLSLFLTELMSNVALTTIMVPLVGSMALGLDVHPFELAAPVAIASSCAFMLPMSTPPNAIVFASGHLSIAQMAKAGFVLNLLAIVLITLFVKYLMPYCFSY